MELTLGPNQFFWEAERWSDFYAAMAATPADRVVLGELVCSKRLPFYQDRIPDAVARLQEVGKDVAITSLALVTLKRERRMTADLFDLGIEVEVNDLTALARLPQGQPFAIGPLVNVYNAGTLDWLARRGARRICLPPELPPASIAEICGAAAGRGVTVEVWAHGRLPLAMAGRCYHARLHGRTKDNCQFACGDDLDGLPVTTLDGQPFLAINGVQTLSASCASAALQVEKLRAAGVGALRLSPQSGDFARVVRLWRDRLDGRIDGPGLARALEPEAPGGRLSDGYLSGMRGAAWSGAETKQEATA